MTIIITDYQPKTTDVIPVRFPGSDRQFNVRSADSLTIGELKAITSGDLDAFYTIFPKDAHPLLDQLHPSQLNDFVAAWTGNPKD